eukprot:5594473-Amphidinium_carterae.1
MFNDSSGEVSLCAGGHQTAIDGTFGRNSLNLPLRLTINVARQRQRLIWQGLIGLRRSVAEAIRAHAMGQAHRGG